MIVFSKGTNEEVNGPYVRWCGRDSREGSICLPERANKVKTGFMKVWLRGPVREDPSGVTLASVTLGSYSVRVRGVPGETLSKAMLKLYRAFIFLLLSLVAVCSEVPSLPRTEAP